MNIKKFHINIATKLMKKSNLQELAKLSESQFIKRVRKNAKAKHFTDDVLKIVYTEMIKRVKK